MKAFDTFPPVLVALALGIVFLLFLQINSWFRDRNKK